MIWIFVGVMLLFFLGSKMMSQVLEEQQKDMEEKERRDRVKGLYAPKDEDESP